MPIIQLLKVASISLGILIVCFLLVWLWQLKSKNAGVVDALWGISFPIQALIYFLYFHNYSPKNVAILILLSIWGLRLSIYLAYRNIGKPEDKRYAQIRLENGDNANFKILTFYLIQALLAFILFLPVLYLFSYETNSFTSYEVVVLIFMAISILLEALSDEQLRAFKSEIENEGQICEKGLWYYSRHPNYFFEWMVWMSIAFIVLPLPFGFLAFICPLLMYIILTKGTGIKLTEATIIETKKDKYQAYIDSTSAFFPWKKRFRKND